MAAKPTKTSSAMIRCMRPPDLGVLIGNLQSTRLRGGSLSQSGAGTLTQRHGALIKTTAEKGETKETPPEAAASGTKAQQNPGWDFFRGKHGPAAIRTIAPRTPVAVEQPYVKVRGREAARGCCDKVANLLRGP